MYLLGELETQEYLSIAYIPGVAEVCKAMEAEHHLANLYTAKGKLVAIVTDGTAFPDLGGIGPAACIPVMEGKSALFKRFANLDTRPVPLDNARRLSENSILRNSGHVISSSYVCKKGLKSYSRTAS